MHETAGAERMKRAVAALLAAALGAGTAAAQSPPGESFFDDFETISTDLWYVSDGWTNGDWMNCTWSNGAVELDDGIVRMNFLPGVAAGERDHSCAEIQTRPRFGHGTFEARFRTSRGSGLNAAFFTYIGPFHEAPHDEIDFEVLMRDPSSVSLNTYVAGTPHHEKVVPVPGGADADFHTYAFIWEPERLRWFVDGTLVHEVADAPLPQTPQKIYVSHWGSDTFTDWMGPFETPEGPVTMELDWVAYTVLGEDCHFPQSVLCSLN
jgi:endo-1,3-1,4-beta-glycanase ExoK